jgi:hypothetical protein
LGRTLQQVVVLLLLLLLLLPLPLLLPVWRSCLGALSAWLQESGGQLQGRKAGVPRGGVRGEMCR